MKEALSERSTHCWLAGTGRPVRATDDSSDKRRRRHNDDDSLKEDENDDADDRTRTKTTLTKPHLRGDGIGAPSQHRSLLEIGAGAPCHLAKPGRAQVEGVSKGGGATPLAILPGDPEANPSNFVGTAQTAWEPAAVPIFIGMTVMLTRNINKEVDYVNGMSAVVEGLYQSGVRVRTRTGYELMVFPWTDEEKRVYFPMRVGYACTLMKMQGATLEHLTVWLDQANVEAAGYVALSRVEHEANWRFVGDPTEHHFTPATGY